MYEYREPLMSILRDNDLRNATDCDMLVVATDWAGNLSPAFSDMTSCGDTIISRDILSRIVRFGEYDYPRHVFVRKLPVTDYDNIYYKPALVYIVDDINSEVFNRARYNLAIKYYTQLVLEGILCHHNSIQIPSLKIFIDNMPTWIDRSEMSSGNDVPVDSINPYDWAADCADKIYNKFDLMYIDHPLDNPVGERMLVDDVDWWPTFVLASDYCKQYDYVDAYLDECQGD